MKNTNWIFKDLNQIPNFGNINKEFQSLLFHRGLTDEISMEKFLNPNLKDLNSPWDLKDVGIAVDLILDAIKNNKSIWIYGDYDVDGITSTSMCYLALKSIGANIRYYIPLRDEGYGLNCEALESISKDGGNLVITVDCGITSHKEIDFANSLGLKVIITDHHDIIQGVFPKASAVINPKREDNIYPFKSLCGAGTAFMLLLALYEKLEKKEEIFKYLDLVALATVADIVPLLNDNRLFVKFGLEQLKKTTLPSLKALTKQLFFEDYTTRVFTPYDIGFIIAPVFNAAGRLEDAKTSVEFLISNDHTKFLPLIDKLIQNNQNRKIIQEDILKKSLEIIEEKELYNKSLILVASEDFHHGVIGIVASKILDKYYKPTIVLEINKEENIAKASCRSTESFNMIEALTKHSHFLTKFGGHHGAAGFSIPLNNIEEFYNSINKYCEEITHEHDTLKPIKIEKFLTLDKLSYGFFDSLRHLEPYGFGNPTPIFAFYNIEYSDLRIIGKDKTHLSLTLKQNGIEAKNNVWFSGAEYYDAISEHRKISVAFKPKLEVFRDKYNYKAFVEDIKFDLESNENYKDYLNSFSKNSALDLENIDFPIKTIFYAEKTLPNSVDFKINISENYGSVTHNNSILGFLDNTTVFTLKKHNSITNDNYIAKVSKTVETDSNFNVFIDIYPNYEFTSYSIQPGKIFIDIKNYLLGDKNFSDFQKSILNSIFKKSENVSTTLEEMSKNFNLSNSKIQFQELEVLLLTIALYYSSIKKKVLIVNDNYTKFKLSGKLSYFCESSNIPKEGYDFYLILGNKNFNNEFFENKKFFVLKD